MTTRGIRAALSSEEDIRSMFLTGRGGKLPLFGVRDMSVSDRAASATE